MELGTAFTIGSTLFSAMSSIAQGNAANEQAKFQAAQYQQQAGQERASAQRRSIEERRKQQLMQSTLVANAAASGGGASDPTVASLSGDIAQEGEYRALSALFEGEETARSLEMGAAAKRYEGKAARAAGFTRAAGSLLSGGTSLYEKYAGDSPDTAVAAPLPWQQQGMMRPRYLGGGVYSGVSNYG